MNSKHALLLIFCFALALITQAQTYEESAAPGSYEYAMKKRFRAEPVRFGKRAPREPVRFGKRSGGRAFYTFNALDHTVDY